MRSIVNKRLRNEIVRMVSNTSKETGQNFIPGQILGPLLKRTEKKKKQWDGRKHLSSRAVASESASCGGVEKVVNTAVYPDTER